MKAALRSVVLILAVGLVAMGIWRYVHNAPRRQALESLNGLQAALESPGPEALLRALVAPAAIRDRTAAEQGEFIRKALRDELSPEGVAALGRKAQFGPLKEVFPAEGDAWAAQAQVKPEECVAFKLERDGLRAEVVLVKPSSPNPQASAREAPYRIVRVNNVKQMAESTISTTEKSQ